MQTYTIKRFYKNHNRNKIIRTGLSLEQAREWCSREDTRKEGIWFDGYIKE